MARSLKCSKCKRVRTVYGWLNGSCVVSMRPTGDKRGRVSNTGYPFRRGIRIECQCGNLFWSESRIARKMFTQGVSVDYVFPRAVEVQNG